MSIWAKWVEVDQRFTFGLTDNGGVEISRENHAQLLAESATGKVLRPGKKGEPVASNPAPPSSGDQQERERIWRTGELARYEWVVTRHRDEQDMGGGTTLIVQQFAELLKYRQALREWPSADVFPDADSRPAPPSWLLDQTQ
ncbi:MULTISPECIES: phage tail assembly chaperone [unclassified Pseudomonas]|uniref:phage tail assembly chaperone n=1 Tax=unclassified Pseudomonas TaxID=196821 RepID=UPI0021184452|nr:MULTISPECIES: phage tail assembly chaperone [unclassified Pseudomonas]